MTREQRLEAALREAGPLVIAHYEDFIFGPCGIPNVTAEMLRVVRLGMTALATPPDPDTRVVSDWQPIETAPKDVLIDIWIASGTRWCDCYYDRICDEWRTSRPSGRLLSIKAQCVSHWMPRPSFPTLIIEGKDQ